MVDNLAEKVEECPLNWGCWVLLAYNWDHENCPLCGVAGCPLFRGCLSIEVNGMAVGTFRIAHYIVARVHNNCYELLIVGVHYSGVSVKRGSTVVCTQYILSGHENVYIQDVFYKCIVSLLIVVIVIHTAANSANWGHVTLTCLVASVIWHTSVRLWTQNYTNRESYMVYLKVYYTFTFVAHLHCISYKPAVWSVLLVAAPPSYYCRYQ